MRQFGNVNNPFATALPLSERKMTYASEENIQLNHNTPYRFPTAGNAIGISQGTGFGNRIGNAVRLHEGNLKLWISQKSDRPNVIYRLTIAAMPYSTSQAFSDISFTTVNNALIAPLDPTKAMILYDKILNASGPGGPIMGSAALISTKERSWATQVVFPINKTVSWATSGNTTRTYIWYYLSAYDAYGTLTTDVISSFAYSSCISFDDM